MPTTALLNPSPYRAEEETDWEETRRTGRLTNIWIVARDVPSTKIERLAECKKKEDAERLALLLNGGAA